MNIYIFSMKSVLPMEVVFGWRESGGGSRSRDTVALGDTSPPSTRMCLPGSALTVLQSFNPGLWTAF